MALSGLSIATRNDIKETNAATETWDFIETGKKNYQDSYVTCGFTGKISINTRLFGNSKVTYTGNSSAAWLGPYPFNADNIVLTNSIYCNGLGSLSISAGYPSGVGFSSTSNSRSANYNYSNDNCWRITTDYSYNGNMPLIVSASQKTSATFKFGSHFIIVDSEVDRTFSCTSPRQYSW